MNWWMVGFFAWIVVSIPVSLLVGRLFREAGEMPAPAPSREDLAWQELERYAATGDEDYYWAACDLMFEARTDIEVKPDGTW